MQNVGAHVEVIGVVRVLDSFTRDAFGTVEVPFRGEKLCPHSARLGLRRDIIG